MTQKSEGNKLTKLEDYVCWTYHLDLFIQNILI